MAATQETLSRTVDVIGLTAHGAGIRRLLLERLRPKIGKYVYIFILKN